MGINRSDLFAGLAGLLFGAGLILSGLANPAKVLAFLDLFGAWDPDLLWVMGGGAVTTFIGYRLVFKKPQPVCGERFHLPERTDIDRPLILGAILFGLGWGLAGYCPGPAIVSLMSFDWQPWVFVFAMVAGMKLHAFISARRPS